MRTSYMLIHSPDGFAGTQDQTEAVLPEGMLAGAKYTISPNDAKDAVSTNSSDSDSEADSNADSDNSNAPAREKRKKERAAKKTEKKTGKQSAKEGKKAAKTHKGDGG